MSAEPPIQISLAEFRAEVAGCRAQIDSLVWDGCADRAELASRLDVLFESVLNALLCGVRAGFSELGPLAGAMREVLPSLRALAGFNEPRVRPLLLRSVRLLERTACDGFVGAADLKWLGTQSVAAAHDAAWTNHSRTLWFDRRSD